MLQGGAVHCQRERSLHNTEFEMLRDYIKSSFLHALRYGPTAKPFPIRAKVGLVDETGNSILTFLDV